MTANGWQPAEALSPLAFLLLPHRNLLIPSGKIICNPFVTHR